MNENEIKRPSGFVWMNEWADLMADLSLEQRGNLITAAQSYFMGKDYDIGDDAVVKMAFRFIAACIDRYNEKYLRTCQKRAEAGRRGRAKQLGQMQANDDTCQQMPANAGYPNPNPNPNPKREDNAPARGENRYAPLNANDVAFADFYRKTFNTEFLWQENTSEAVQRIADSIADKISESGGESDPAEMPDNITKFLEAVYRLGDQWLNERFTPSLLAKQFNQLYQRIISATNGNKRTGNNKRGGNAPNPYGVSDEFLEDLARQLGGGV